VHKRRSRRCDRPALCRSEQPDMTRAEATNVTLALAGTSSIAKLEATMYAKSHGIPIEEFRAHARNTVAEADRRSAEADGR
jgi:hypothetical protein